MPRLKFTQRAPRCRCDTIPHRVWCPRKAAYDRAYPLVVDAARERMRADFGLSPYRDVRR